MKRFVLSLFAVLSLSVEVAAHAEVVSVAVGRLWKEPPAAPKTDVNLPLTGLTCMWTCTDSLQKAVDFGRDSKSVPGLVPYVTAVSNCAAPTENIVERFKGCCRPAPYSDWGVVANAMINGQKVRLVAPCGGASQ